MVSSSVISRGKHPLRMGEAATRGDKSSPPPPPPPPPSSSSSSSSSSPSSPVTKLQMIILLLEVSVCIFLFYYSSFSSIHNTNAASTSTSTISSVQTQNRELMASFLRVDSTNKNGATALRQDPTSSSTDSKQQEQEQERHSRFYNYLQEYNYTPPWTTLHRNDIKEMRREQRALCGYYPDYDAFFDLPPKHRSANREDQRIFERFFKNMTRPGTYVEIGAFDGIQESNTRFFDECLGWKGLLIEANPLMYPKTRLARPHSHRMSFAPSCSNSSQVPFHATVFTTSGIDGEAQAFNGDPTISVPCGPLQPVLEDIFGTTDDNNNNDNNHPPTIIDFVSLDVAGSEPSVLETIDFDRVMIHVLIVEVENAFCKIDRDCQRRNKVRKIMSNVGYKHHWGVVPFSDVYVHPESPFQLGPYLAKLDRKPYSTREE